MALVSLPLVALVSFPRHCTPLSLRYYWTLGKLNVMDISDLIRIRPAVLDLKHADCRGVQTDGWRTDRYSSPQNACWKKKANRGTNYTAKCNDQETLRRTTPHPPSLPQRGIRGVFAYRGGQFWMSFKDVLSYMSSPFGILRYLKKKL